jgi:SAM-dependent methyltransferase
VLTDQSAGMVRAAVDRSTQRLVAAVGVVADAQSLPVRDRVADVVVANHMLYHVPDIARAIAELARVVTPDGVALVSTNGGDHMRELTSILVATFGHGLPDEVSRFGRETGGDLLRASFADVEWHPFADRIACTDPADVVAYMTSFPPGEGATPPQRAALQAGIDAAFAAGAGTFHITKETGTFVARRPR